MGTISKTKSWVDAEKVNYTDLNADFDTLYNEFNGNIDNNNIKSAAAIDITKVSGTAVNLSDAQTIAGIKSFDVAQAFKQAATPATPASTYYKLYFKSDGLLYKLDSAGVEALAGASPDGWTSDSHTLTYASASTFTIAGADLTATYQKGTKIKFTQTTAKYFIVASSTFSTDTTVTVIVNTDYTIANAAITLPSYSYQDNPQGFPASFTWTPTFPTSGGSMTFGTTTINRAKYRVHGKYVFYEIEVSGTTGGTNDNNIPFTLPVASVSYGSSYLPQASVSLQNGTSQLSGVLVTSSTTVVAVRRYDQANIGLGSGRVISVSGSYEF